MILIAYLVWNVLCGALLLFYDPDAVICGILIPGMLYSAFCALRLYHGRRMSVAADNADIVVVVDGPGERLKNATIESVIAQGLRGDITIVVLMRGTEDVVSMVGCPPEMRDGITSCTHRGCRIVYIFAEMGVTLPYESGRRLLYAFSPLSPGSIASMIGTMDRTGSPAVFSSVHSNDYRVYHARIRCDTQYVTHWGGVEAILVNEPLGCTPDELCATQAVVRDVHARAQVPWSKMNTWGIPPRIHRGQFHSTMTTYLFYTIPLFYLGALAVLFGLTSIVTTVLFVVVGSIPHIVGFRAGNVRESIGIFLPVPLIEWCLSWKRVHTVRFFAVITRGTGRDSNRYSYPRHGLEYADERIDWMT